MLAAFYQHKALKNTGGYLAICYAPRAVYGIPLSAYYYIASINRKDHCEEASTGRGLSIR
jgi:hypothetical protein